MCVFIVNLTNMQLNFQTEDIDEDWCGRLEWQRLSRMVIIQLEW